MTAIRNTELRRPLTARSAVASLLLGMHPPRMRAAQLVRWCRLLGISEGAARVALHRMAGRGELRTEDGAYELAGALSDRQRTQDWSLDPRPLPWAGEWRLAVVGPEARPAGDRQELRDAMRRLRCAPLREGVWIRPDNLPADAAPPQALAVADEQCRWFVVRPLEADDDLLAGFDPAGWAARARSLLERLAPITAELAHDPDGTLAEAFLLGAEVLSHVRADPLLPEVLVDQPWPGAELRDAYRAYQDAFAAAVTAWFAR